MLLTYTKNNNMKFSYNLESEKMLNTLTKQHG